MQLNTDTLAIYVNGLRSGSFDRDLNDFQRAETVTLLEQALLLTFQRRQVEGGQVYRRWLTNAIGDYATDHSIVAVQRAYDIVKGL